VSTILEFKNALQDAREKSQRSVDVTFSPPSLDPKQAHALLYPSSAYSSASSSSGASGKGAELKKEADVATGDPTTEQQQPQQQQYQQQHHRVGCMQHLAAGAMEELAHNHNHNDQQQQQQQEGEEEKGGGGKSQGKVVGSTNWGAQEFAVVFSEARVGLEFEVNS
jgi:hypothetical protein